MPKGPIISRRNSLNLVYSAFSFSLTGYLTKTPTKKNLTYYLLIAGGRTDGFIQRAFASSEKQMALYRIWTRVADFISYDDNSN